MDDQLAPPVEHLSGLVIDDAEYIGVAGRAHRMVPADRSRRVFLDLSGDDEVDWGEIAAIIEEAYCLVAPKEFVAQLEST